MDNTRAARSGGTVSHGFDPQLLTLMSGRCLHIFNFVSRSTLRGLHSAFPLQVYTARARCRREPSMQTLTTRTTANHKQGTRENVLIRPTLTVRQVSKCNNHQRRRKCNNHRRRSTNEYGNFQFRRSWTSSNDLIKNTIVNCPLFRRCGCKCQTKIVQTPVQTILSISNQHTTADHLA